MTRIFVSPEKIDKDLIVIDGDEFIHLVHVLRSRAGDIIWVIDGTGREYRAQIHSIDHKRCAALILEAFSGTRESPLFVTLYQALIKIPRFEVILEKATEMGVARIVPMRCLQGPAGNEVASPCRIKRWKRIIQGAACQSRRTRVPELHSPLSFRDALKETHGITSLICTPDAPLDSLKRALSSSNGSLLNVFLGPEGGFADEELAIAVSLGAFPVSLGRRILRAETAALAALARIFHELEG
jgi:16S rRNA (uracil1498-N3)-methyltransferase